MKKKFSFDELSVLEALEIKGGCSSFAEATRDGCSNNVTGCGCTVIITPKPKPKPGNGGSQQV